MIAGNGDILETDNLSGYTIWVNGNGLFNTDAILNLGASVTNENRGTILLESSNNTYQSNIATGSYTLTNPARSPPGSAPAAIASSPSPSSTREPSISIPIQPSAPPGPTSSTPASSASPA